MKMWKPGHFFPSEMRRFILESNAIEGVMRPLVKTDLDPVRNFLLHPEPGVVDVERLAKSFDPTARVKPEAVEPLAKVLSALQGVTPYSTHIFLRNLEPLTAENGRVCRTIWAWQMFRRDGKLPMAFLQPFYAQTLEAS